MRRNCLYWIASALLAFGAAAQAQTQAEPEIQRTPRADMPGPMRGGPMPGGRYDPGMPDYYGMRGQGGMMHGMRFPPGYERLELEMHAEMMENIARILRKYAAQLPEPPRR